MPQETALIYALARLARIPFWMKTRRPFERPRKVLIVKPCCISQVMLATPLLAALAHAFPDAQFDWLVDDWARPAVIGNPHISQLVSSGDPGLEHLSWSEMLSLANRISAAGYDTCFVPSRSSLLAWLVWRGGIKHRIGLNDSGRGFAHTLAVGQQRQVRHEGEVYLSLARAIGLDTTGYGPEFYPSDTDRAAIAERLVAVESWSDDTPLVVIHSGGGTNPRRSDLSIRWPAERYVRLGNHLARRHRARLVLVSATDEQPLVDEIAGMMSGLAANWAGDLRLGEVAALSEIADLYVGNDSGLTHVAAAVGCPTLAIFGPTDPAVSRPIGAKGEITVLWRRPDGERPFSWERGVKVQEAVEAVDALLQGRSAVE